MVLSLRGSMVENNGNQSMESVDKQSVEPSEFLDELRSYELKNRRLLTATDIQNLELEYNEFVMNYFVYHQQFNTVAEYENSFLQLKRWAETWNEEKFDEQWVVDRFVAGLKEEIRNNVNLWRPEFLQRAIILAKWQELCLVDKVFDKIPEPTEAKTNYEIKKEFVYHEEIEREPSMKGNFMGLFTLVSSCHVSVFAPFICSSLITDCGCPTFKKIPGRVENSGISKLKENGLYWGERGKSENIKGTCSNYVLYPPILDVVQYNFDLFVIGAGSGDVVRASRFFAQYGAKVGICVLPFHPISSKVIGGVGGTCVNRGCVPKMILVYGASFGPEIEDARNYGWEINEKNGFNWKKLWHKKTEGKVSGPNEVEITQLDDTKLSYTANHISVVTSNRAQHLAIPGQKLAITSDEVLSLEELPKSLVILGGGYIVVEFASIWRGMGANVNLCFIKELPLRGFDEMRAVVARNLKGRGINLHAQTTLTEPVKTDDGIKVRTEPGEELLADVVLFATGRSPNTKKLNMGVVGVELDETGDINVSEYFRTNIHSIWAAGDVTNQMNLTPMSLMEGTLFAKTIFGGEPSKPDYNNIPCVVFFIPPLSAVGLREEQAIEQEKGDILVFTSISNPMKNSISGRQEKAIMKLIVDGLTDKVLGVSMGGADNSLHPTILDENINRPNEIFHLHIDGHLVVEGRYLLLGGADASVIVYDVHCAAEYVGGTIVKHKSILVVDKQHKHGHKYAVSLAIWYPVDTGLFIPGSYDHFISVWDTNTIQAVMHFKMHGKVYRTAMSTLATSHMLIAAEIEDVQVRLCVIASGAFSHILTSHLDGVMAVVTTSEWVLLTGECDGTIRFWDIRRVGCFLVLNQPHTQLGRCPPLLQRASIIKVSASKSFSTGQRLHPGFVPSQDRFTAHYGAIIGLKMIADGLYLLSAGYDSRLRLWDVESCCNTLANFDIVRFPTSKAMQLAITPDSGLLFVPCMTAAKAFSVWSGETMMTFRGHYENVNCCWYNVQDQELYTGGNDRQVLVWSPYKLSSEDENEQHDFVVRHPDHFRETPSPSSVVGSNMVGEIKSSGTGELKNLSCWDPVKVPMVELTVFIHDIKDLEHVHVLISPLVTDIPTVRRFIAINWVVLKWENSNPLCILVGTTNFLDPNILDAFTEWNKLACVNFEDKHEGRTSVCVIGKCGAVGDSKKDKLKRNAETWNPMNSSYVRKANGGDWESYNNTCILV